jgi:hypothetical protein
MFKFFIILYLSVSVYASAKQIHYIVKNVNVRSSVEIADNILFTLPKGATSITILQELEAKGYHWSEVQFIDGRKGWVVSDYIKSIDKNFVLAFYEKMDDMYRLRIWHPLTTVVDEVFTLSNGVIPSSQKQREDSVVGALLLHVDQETHEMYVYDRVLEKTIFKVSDVVDAFWVTDYKNLKRTRGHIIIW